MTLMDIFLLSVLFVSGSAALGFLTYIGGYKKGHTDGYADAMEEEDT